MTTFNAIVILFLLASFPPVTRVFHSEVSKSTGIAFSLLILISLLAILQRGKIRMPVLPYEFIFFLALPFFYSIYGIVLGNDTYIVAKELYFFSIPLLAIFTFFNLPLQRDRVMNAIISIGIIYSVLQIIFGTYGLIYDFPSRDVYRFRYVLLSSGILPLCIVFSLASATKAADLLKAQNLLMPGALLVTLGRNEAFFLLFFSIICAVSYIQRTKPLMLLFLALLACSPFAYLAFIYVVQGHFPDTSLLWRYIEIYSFFENVRGDAPVSLLLGRGLGSLMETVAPLVLFSGDVYYEIDRFHNLFIFLIFKTGIIGIGVFVALLLSLFFRYKSIPGSRLGFFMIAFLFFNFLVLSNTTGSFTMSLHAGLVMGLSYYYLLGSPQEYNKEGASHNSPLRGN